MADWNKGETGPMIAIAVFGLLGLFVLEFSPRDPVRPGWWKLSLVQAEGRANPTAPPRQPPTPPKGSPKGDDFTRIAPLEPLPTLKIDSVASCPNPAWPKP